MPFTTSFSQGDVVLVPFPFTDLSAVKQRPALVLSPERLNKVRSDIVVAAITSQIPNIIGEDEILLSEADLKTAGLRELGDSDRLERRQLLPADAAQPAGRRLRHESGGLQRAKLPLHEREKAELEAKGA